MQKFVRRLAVSLAIWVFVYQMMSTNMNWKRKKNAVDIRCAFIISAGSKETKWVKGYECLFFV